MRLKSIKRNIMLFFILSPYIGVVLGLYLLKNAFAAIFLYHFGILIFAFMNIKQINIYEYMNHKKYFLLIVSMIICFFGGILIFIIWDYIKIPNINLNLIFNDFKLSGINKF